MKRSVKEEIIEIISDIGKIPKEKIDPNQNFSEAALDSLVMTEVLYFIEVKFEINIPHESFGNIHTVNDLIKLVEEKVKERPVKKIRSKKTN